MKSIRIFAFALVLGLAGVLSTGNGSQAAGDCCVTGASCCTGGACCTAHKGQ
jgi:hypothetical protein